MDDESGDDDKDELRSGWGGEVNWDKNGEADGMNLEVDSKDKVTVGWEDCLQNDLQYVAWVV